jgi:hypothetical protein
LKRWSKRFAARHDSHFQELFQKRDIFYAFVSGCSTAWTGGPEDPGLLLLMSKGNDAMNQSRNRSTARAIAIAKADESAARKALFIRVSVIAAFALAALVALPSFWSF